MDAAPFPPGPVVVMTEDDATAADAVALGGRLADLLGRPLDVRAGASAPPQPAAVVVLGHRHRRHVATSTARRLLQRSPSPIAVAPRGYAGRGAAPIRHVGAGFEPTDEGALALAVAHELAVRARGDVRAIGVVLPLAPLAVNDLRDPAPYLDDERRTVRARLERALADLPATVPATADARVGSPAVELAAASTELDLLVCGSRRRGPLRARLHGSVAEGLLANAACPLLIVPGAGAANYGRERRESVGTRGG
jgi:nucleotide-binding universal stress UspA family protein